MLKNMYINKKNEYKKMGSVLKISYICKNKFVKNGRTKI
jgi:hypothetical protein